jgi:hypothetical protein
MFTLGSSPRFAAENRTLPRAGWFVLSYRRRPSRPPTAIHTRPLETGEITTVRPAGRLGWVRQSARSTRTATVGAGRDAGRSEFCLCQPTGARRETPEPYNGSVQDIRAHGDL